MAKNSLYLIQLKEKAIANFAMANLYSTTTCSCGIRALL